MNREEQKKLALDLIIEAIREASEVKSQFNTGAISKELASQIDKIYSQPPEGLREKIRTSMPIVHCENCYLHKARSDSIKKQFQEPL